MECVVLGCDDSDRIDIWNHLFSRQRRILIKDNCGYIVIDIETMKELSFLSNVLQCKFLFTPNNFEHNNIKYNTIKIVREEGEDGTYTYSRNGILLKK